MQFRYSGKEIELEKNQIGDEGAIALAEALPFWKEDNGVINLSGNQIGDDGAKALAAALPRSEVSSLDLQNNEISYEGEKALKGCVNIDRKAICKGSWTDGRCDEHW